MFVFVWIIWIQTNHLVWHWFHPHFNCILRSSSLSSKSNTIMMIMNQKRKPLMERSNAVTITLLCWYNKMNNKIYNWQNFTFLSHTQTHTPQTKTLLEFFTLNTLCTHQSFYIQTHAPMNVWTIWFFFCSSVNDNYHQYKKNIIDCHLMDLITITSHSIQQSINHSIDQFEQSIYQSKNEW